MARKRVAQANDLRRPLFFIESNPLISYFRQLTKQSFMKRLLLILSVLICGALTNAQSVSVQSIQAEASRVDDSGQGLENIIREYYNAIQQSLQSNGNSLEALHKFLDPHFRATGYTLDQNGDPIQTGISMPAYENSLIALSKLSTFSANFELDNVQFSQATESFGSIQYSVIVTGSLNNEEIIRFKSIVHAYLRRNASGSWVIFDLNGVNLYNNQEMSVCPVVFQKSGKDDTHFEVSVLSPCGFGFNLETNAFIFKDSDKKTVVTCGQNVYIIEALQVSCIKDNGQKANIHLGRATGRLDCINLILAQHLYNGKCLGLKTVAN
jgi:hypothetical protein